MSRTVDEKPVILKTVAVTYEKNTARKKAQKYRLLVQSLFAALCVWIGIEFYFFVKYLETGGLTGSTYRPPGVVTAAA